MARRGSGRGPTTARAMGRGFPITPTLLLAAAFSIAIVYLVVKNGDRLTKLSYMGAAAEFDGRQAAEIPPAEQHERSRRLELTLEEEVRTAPPSAASKPADPMRPSDQQLETADLGGVWSDPDGRFQWSVDNDNGYLVFHESTPAMPNATTAAGYGTYDGHVWSLQLQNYLGENGTAQLSLRDDDTLEGDLTLTGRRYHVVLKRQS